MRGWYYNFWPMRMIWGWHTIIQDNHWHFDWTFSLEIWSTRSVVCLNIFFWGKRHNTRHTHPRGVGMLRHMIIFFCISVTAVAAVHTFLRTKVLVKYLNKSKSFSLLLQSRPTNQHRVLAAPHREKQTFPCRNWQNLWGPTGQTNSKSKKDQGKDV